MKFSQENDMLDSYKIGGTAFSDSESEDMLEAVDPPYLPPLTDEQQKRTYTLVLDLDETLVHYFEIGIQGKFLIRPGVAKFLTEMK